MKKFLSILFFSIFLFAQFGKVISYAYCKWETRAEIHCDCDKILSEDEHKNADQMAKLNINAKWEEPIILHSIDECTADKCACAVATTIQSSPIVKGFPSLCFHPPAIG